MMHIRRGLRALLAAIALVGATLATAADLPPAELFFKPADIQKAVLSPSGRWLALSTPVAGARIALVVFDLKDWGKVQLAASFNDADVRNFYWVTDDRLVFQVIDSEVGGGDQRFNASLFSVRPDGSELRNLIELRRQFVTSDSKIGRGPLPWNHGLLHVPNDGSNEVIVGEYKFDSTGELRAIVPKRLNVVDGRARLVLEGLPADATDWWFDAKGEPRIMLRRVEGRDHLWWKADAAADWKELASFDRLQAPFVPRFFDAAGDLFVTVAVGPEGTRELRKFDFARKAPATDSLVRTPGFDFRGELIAETPGDKTLGVQLETDAVTTVWFDESLKALQKEADDKLPGRVNVLRCRRCGKPDMVVLIHSYADRDPGHYLVYRADTKVWRLVGSQRKGTDGLAMATLDFHRIKARDGRDLPVWVTTPPGKAAAPRPAVVLVHGGPWVRGGHWQWDPMPQFLASRGYVVIEPEFRGSEGYGMAHFEAGIRQWGLAMQDDVADALLWAVDKGLADGRRACIAGGSYGGYATLMGLVRHPDLYRCGAAWVAVTDPRLLFKWSAIGDSTDENRHFDFPMLLGDPETDAARFEATAPVVQAARIKAPVLLAMGARDWRVPLEHGQRMRDALTDAGNPPEWILYNDEGHGWLTLANQVDFAQRLERFLAKHLKP
jgi:dipeptidyl aminopeptidase/acylaminoacyl peptidase